jgi:hypothetical protein
MSRTFGDFTKHLAAKQGEFPLAPEQAPAPEAGLIKCNDKSGIFRCCRYCRSTRFRIGPGAGPHAASLRCDRCGAGGRWLSKSRLAELTT